MEIDEAYKVLLENYDRHGEAFENCCVPSFREEYDELLRLASIEPGSSVLDLGSGTGGLSIAASGIIGAKSSILGVDILEAG